MRRDIKGEANNEADVKRTFKFDMKGKFAVLQTPMEMSKAIYAKVREKVSLEDGYEKLIRSAGEAHADIVQVSDDLNTVHVKQAPEAQKKLEFLIADEWEAVPKKERLRLPCHTSSRTSRGSPCASLAARTWHTRLPRGPRGRALRCSRSRISTLRRRRWVPLRLQLVCRRRAFGWHEVRVRDPAQPHRLARG